MTESTGRRELAFYYPNPFWVDGDWIKNLVLYFDGVAFLVPKYMQVRLEGSDPAIVAGLREMDLLHVIEPEKAVDKIATEQLAQALADIIASGKLDALAKDGTAFHELSRSRLGWDGGTGLAEMIFDELKARNLARESEDGVSIPMHPKVRYLILVLLTQILRARNQDPGVELSPVTDTPRIVDALGELLAFEASPSNGSVVSFDMNIVGVDVSSFPIDEVLDFRRQNYDGLQRYRRQVRLFAAEVSALPGETRGIAFRQRQDELDDLSADLKKVSEKAWRQPAAFALSLTGAALSALTGNPIGAVLAATGAALAYTAAVQPDLGAYSYIFRARAQFR